MYSLCRMPQVLSRPPNERALKAPREKPKMKMPVARRVVEAQETVGALDIVHQADAEGAGDGVVDRPGEGYPRRADPLVVEHDLVCAPGIGRQEELGGLDDVGRELGVGGVPGAVEADDDVLHGAHPCEVAAT